MHINGDITEKDLPMANGYYSGIELFNDKKTWILKIEKKSAENLQLIRWWIKERGLVEKMDVDGFELDADYDGNVRLLV